jgi:hypothetical protein
MFDHLLAALQKVIHGLVSENGRQAVSATAGGR